MINKIKILIKDLIKRIIGSNTQDAPKYVPLPYEVVERKKQSLKNKCGIVTGATGAIGSATVLKLASEGAIVGVGGRSLDKITEVISFILKIIPEAQLEPVIIDVTDDNLIESSIQKFVNKFNHIDFFINNAGGGPRSSKKPLSNQLIELIDEILSVNLRGSILCTRVVSRFMIDSKSGVIINLGSVMGLNGKEEWTEYSAAKAGILGLTKSQALELGKYNIRVNCVSPGMVFQQNFDRGIPITETHKNALQRFGYTDEVAALINFLVSDEAKYITGQNITIDGGRSIGLK